MSNIPPWERRLSRLPEAPEADISEFERYPSFEEPAPVEPWLGNEVTIYGPGPDFEALPPGGGFTAEDWFDQALRPKEDLLRDWGLDNIDIIEQLISRGYDYTYIDFDGQEKSGLWRDWRDAYAGMYG
jgi:hypothetical protein